MSDCAQIQYMSENGVKILGDVNTSGNLRARNNNVTFSNLQPRIITCNSESLEEWLGSRVGVALPLFRKFFIFFNLYSYKMKKTKAVESITVS